MDILNNLDNSIISEYIIPWSISIVSALVVFIIGRWIAKLIVKGLGRVLEKAKVEATLSNFLGNIIYAALLIAVIIAALNQLGVDTTSVVAVFATAGLAVGLALKDSLGNFAAGVMLILFKPFKIGDFVEAGGSAGTVESITVFNTVMRTGDNREVIIPNAHIYDGTIINVSARDTRRVDLVFGIGYEDNIKEAKEVIEQVLAAEERILKDPAPSIAVGELADCSVNINVRPWVKSGDYWGVHSDLLENVKEAFDTKGISIPYPQMDIHHPNAT